VAFIALDFSIVESLNETALGKGTIVCCDDFVGVVANGVGSEFAKLKLMWANSRLLVELEASKLPLGVAHQALPTAVQPLELLKQARGCH
jgi:hypothetical protein